MFERFQHLVRISSADWPERKGAARPGDLSTWMPQGVGIGAPMVLLPWDRPEALEQRSGYYGHQSPAADPIKSAPVTHEAGGVLYFADEASDEDLAAMLRLCRVYGGERQYAVFAAASANPEEDRYLTQFRMVTRFALLSSFRVIDSKEYESFPEQPLTLEALVPAFIRAEHEHWGGGWPESSRLEGCIGGDGDWARESLAFGFAVENGYQGVYRLWSRAWLVTK
jgi:hypothetical protein